MVSFVSVVGGLRRRLRALHRPDAAKLRPRLAPGVRLIGPMTESAFADQPWLVERNGRFLQVTELLYRIAELADGKRSLREIAHILSSTRPVAVSAEQLLPLITARLVPIGIIAPDGVLQT